MTRTVTGLCVAAAFGVVASLGAQTTGTTDQSQRTHESMSRSSSDEVTITGCLQKGADGNYVLANAKMEPAGSAMSGASTSSTGTSGTTAGTTGSTTGSTASGTTTTSETAGSAMSSGTTWQLSGGSDLDKHVGHKIQVTGREAPARQDDAAATSTTAGTTAAGTTGSATGSTAGTSGEAQQRAESTSSTPAHRLEVKSVKMISTSCS